MNLVARLQELGLAMGNRYPDGHCVTWTTDERKAEAAHAAGARIRPYRSEVEHPRFSGWEVIAHTDAVVEE